MDYLVSPCYFGVPNNEKREVSFEITNCCNLHCIHCMNDSTQKSSNIGLPWEKMTVLIDELYENDFSEIYISGGEPTQYPFFRQLIKKTKSLGMLTLVATNAYDIEPYLEDIKKYVDVVFVSIDGISETHNHFRGVPDAYQKTIANISRMVELNIPVRISTTVSKNNISQLEELISEIKKIGIFQIHFTVLVNVGRAKHSDILVSNEEYIYISEKINNLKEKYEQEDFLITTRRNAPLSDKTEPCYGGKKMFHIDACGNVSPCSYVAKCQLGQPYKTKWTLGRLPQCLNNCSKFQDICKKRDSYFGHSSCAALASLTDNSDHMFSLDPLDIIFKDMEL